MKHGGRRYGKSYTTKLLAEGLLDAGKTVAFCTKDKTEIKKRRGHLTLIKLVKDRQGREYIPPVTYLDEEI